MHTEALSRKMKTIKQNSIGILKIVKMMLCVYITTIKNFYKRIELKSEKWKM